MKVKIIGGTPRAHKGSFLDVYAKLIDSSIESKKDTWYVVPVTEGCGRFDGGIPLGEYLDRVVYLSEQAKEKGVIIGEYLPLGTTLIHESYCQEFNTESNKTAVCLLEKEY